MAKPVKHYGRWRIRWIDENGKTQNIPEQIAKYWNKTFDHTFRVSGLDNSVQPWRIAW